MDPSRMAHSVDSPVEYLWQLASQGRLVPVSDIPVLKLVSNSVRTTMVQQGIIPAIRIGGRWHSDSEIVVAALREENDRHFATLGKKKHHVRAKSKQGVSAQRRAQFDSAIAELQSMGILVPKS